ncbi:(3R)-3-hydroxyacyl-CoA dehydrogenase [Phymastichus coffea]|uniref:(3R)-3-hydroxyacyl-CoA dehydrogenase n=1 Tax=Phymastichus coffea TaxID=108790 RepID=UPI00273C6D77|nr:(3R)-3-hydroxyacyl-CoA dehydrogenase [Phymastichus coffea]
MTLLQCGMCPVCLCSYECIASTGASQSVRLALAHNPQRSSIIITAVIMASGMLSGKLAIVTGAGSGIGRAAAALLAREGAKVIAADQNVRAAEDTVSQLQGLEHISVGIDVKSKESIEEAFNTVKRHFLVPPSLVVNSAGITRDNFLLKLSEEDFNEVLNVNLKGTFLVTQYAAKVMLAAAIGEGGSIVNVASIIGKTGNIGQSNYAASKAGVEALTKSAAMEFGQFGIRVNAVLPGFIETPMTQTVPDKVKQMFIERIPLKRMGKAHEVAEVILFLTSTKSSYINGASIDVTGGMH